MYQFVTTLTFIGQTSKEALQPYLDYANQTTYIKHNKDLKEDSECSGTTSFTIEAPDNQSALVRVIKMVKALEISKTECFTLYVDTKPFFTEDGLVQTI